MTQQESTVVAQPSRCESGESDVTVDETTQAAAAHGEDGGVKTGGSGGSEYMYVLDPEGRNTGVYGILIPVDAIVETRALRRHRRTSNPPPSLCLLFQAGRCRASTHCQQVHVPAEKVIEVRERSATGSTCCLEHGDVHSVMSDMAQWDISVVRMTGADEAEEASVPLHSLARTATLERLKKRAKGAVPTFGVSQVCRLHQRGGCSYGKECRHVHLCREFMRKWEAERPRTVASATTATDSDEQAEQQQQQQAEIETETEKQQQQGNTAAAVAEAKQTAAGVIGEREKQQKQKPQQTQQQQQQQGTNGGHNHHQSNGGSTTAAATTAVQQQQPTQQQQSTANGANGNNSNNGSKGPIGGNRPRPQVQVHATQPVPSITPKTALRTFATTFTAPGEPPTQSPTATNIAALLKNLHFDPSASSNFSPTNLTKGGVTFQAAATTTEQPSGAGKNDHKPIRANGH